MPEWRSECRGKNHENAKQRERKHGEILLHPFFLLPERDHRGQATVDFGGHEVRRFPVNVLPNVPLVRIHDHIVARLPRCGEE